MDVDLAERNSEEPYFTGKSILASHLWTHYIVFFGWGGGVYVCFHLQLDFKDRYIISSPFITAVVLFV